VPDNKAMSELIAALCGYARYARERQMAQGYIPLPGGHRAGVCGQMITAQDALCAISRITSVCIRIARSIDGASGQIRPHLRQADGQPLRVLLFGPPGCGKTTVLRDAALYLSDYLGYHVAIADEREELACCGEDRGRRVDVLAGANKAEAMHMLLRSMAPEVLVTDEIGRAEDAQAVMEAVRCGVGLLASAHAASLEALGRRPMLRDMMESGAFDRYILLGRYGTCRQVWDAQGRTIAGG